MKSYRKELWFPTLLDRDFYDSWKEKGALSMERRCSERREEILKSHVPEPLDDDISRDLDKISKEAEKNLKKRF